MREDEDSKFLGAAQKWAETVFRELTAFDGGADLAFRDLMGLERTERFSLPGDISAAHLGGRKAHDGAGFTPCPHLAAGRKHATSDPGWERKIPVY